MNKPKVAIVGSGISGMATAYYLHKTCDIKIFEKEARVGGHTATIDFECDGHHYSIDTGFIVFNDRNYPLFQKILDDCGVAYQPTSMGFSVSCDKTGLEYCGNNVSGLFAQKKNLVSLSHWQMLRNIVRFNNIAAKHLDDGNLSDEISLQEYLSEHKFKGRFVSHYLIPMASAIWSKSSEASLAMPVLFFLQFFKNHGLLSVTNRPQWFVVQGGSKNYIPKVTKNFSDKIVCNSPVTSVKRSSEGVQVIVNGKADYFDYVVFACHSDQVMRLLEDPTEVEKSIISSCQYIQNEVVLHWDDGLLPSNKLVWSSWNYRILNSSADNYAQSEAVLTYNMNILQGLSSDKTFCVSLNCTDKIDKEKIIGIYHYSHPTFSIESIYAQSQWQSINARTTWFCGAWWGNGFHEDGVVSAKRVADALLLEIDQSEKQRNQSQTAVSL